MPAIVCDEGAMEILKGQVDMPINTIESIIESTISLQTDLASKYEGKASEAIEESFTTLLKHVELLKLSFEVSKEFVQYTIDEMKGADEELALQGGAFDSFTNTLSSF